MKEPIESGEELTGGGSSGARLVDGVVYRLARPWTATVHRVLRFLEEEGFSGAPRIYGSGVSSDGFETLVYIEGDDVPQIGLSEAAAFRLGALLRSAHDTLSSFKPTGDEVWMPWWGRALPGDGWVLGHCDVAPWNLVCRDDVPVALIDWDTCGPVARRWELAQTVWLNAQLFDDDVAESQGLPSLRDRMVLARSICDGYGLDNAQRRQLPEAMIETAVRTAAQEAVDSGVTEFGYSPVKHGLLGGGEPFSGHELAWAMTWRIRSARWLLDNLSTIGAGLEAS